MYAVRQWSVRNSRKLEWLYQCFEGILIALHPFWLWIGYSRIEKPIRAVEKSVKRVMFDCQMCGSCVLSQTGMSCPMNCPKELRNGPCGGVRSDGYCVDSTMRCVWVDAWEEVSGCEITRTPGCSLLGAGTAWPVFMAERSAEEA